MIRTHCLSCGSDNLEEVFNLGNHAWCNDFLTEDKVAKTYPLVMDYCNNCTLFQLDAPIPKEIMFSNHTYVSGTSKTLTEHFRTVNKKLVEQFNIKKGDKFNSDLIVEFGSNDGTCLKTFEELGIGKIIGIESAKNIAKIANDNGITTLNGYFNEEFVDNHFDSLDKAKVITCAGVFFHLEEIHSVIRGIKKLLDKNGIFVIHFMYLGDILNNLTFDQIYHEHLCLYTLKSLSNLLRPHGLELFDAEKYPIHGGTMVVKVCHSDSSLTELKTQRLKNLEEFDKFNDKREIKDFVKKVESSKYKLVELLISLKKDDNRIIGMGAPAKGNTLLTYFNINNFHIDYILEKNKLKVGLYTPVSNIIIKDEDVVVNELLLNNNSLENYYFVILAWNFADEILANNQALLNKGANFIVPFPYPKIINKENYIKK